MLERWEKEKVYDKGLEGAEESPRLFCTMVRPMRTQSPSPCAEQDPQGHYRALQDHGRILRTLRSGVGLPRLPMSCNFMKELKGDRQAQVTGTIPRGREPLRKNT